MIPHDKQLHLIAGVVIGGAVAMVTGWAVAGIAAGLAAGVAKEAVDAVRNHLAARRGLPPVATVEGADALVTFGGGVVASLAVWALGFAR